ncbi:MAG: hypothetical protein IJ833_01185 [Lachnospiraceae bacterium]|nr:hypothetical protein [Lachnospiraceae bacterium]
MREPGYSPTRIRSKALKMLQADKDFQKSVAENTLEHKKKVQELLKQIEIEAFWATKEVMSGTAKMS